MAPVPFFTRAVPFFRQCKWGYNRKWYNTTHISFERMLRDIQNNLNEKSHAYFAKYL